MPSEVKMPQLGMNQDSAVIVSWLKGAGDKVTSGEPIFEVETDKATMEVEAASDGYLAGILAVEGADVPVGDVIAMIVETEAAVAEHVSASPATPAKSESAESPDAERKVAVQSEQVPEPAATATPATPTVPKLGAPQVAPTGKVLASPLAKRMAAERGIDLAGLRATGVPEPIHATDLSSAPAGGQSQLTAKVDAGTLTALLQRSQNADRTMLLAAFTSGAWRSVFDVDDALIAIRGMEGTIALYPERHIGGEDQTPKLSLVDLCDTRIGAYASASGGMTLTVAKDSEAFVLTLSFNESLLPLSHAVSLLDAIAARVEDPIRQLI
jgi:pyruvate/2-oxoglutarate dehydrogenase complex dihydrolipoamide acyltransferase (E2) component